MVEPARVLAGDLAAHTQGNRCGRVERDWEAVLRHLPKQIPVVLRERRGHSLAGQVATAQPMLAQRLTSGTAISEIFFAVVIVTDAWRRFLRGRKARNRDPGLELVDRMSV